MKTVERQEFLLASMIMQGSRNYVTFAVDKLLSSFSSLTKLGISGLTEGLSTGGSRWVSPHEPLVPRSKGLISDYEDKYPSLGYLEYNPPTGLTKEEVEKWKALYGFLVDFKLFYIKQNPNSGGQYMFALTKKHTIIIEEVKSADREWNNRYTMVQGPIDEAGSPWIALSVWRHPKRACTKFPAITNEFVENFVKMKNAQKTHPHIGGKTPLAVVA
ncbi:hypothetical protein L484_016157 [Morus notabilis]|uniref:Uncharacterized protein n=1 Tax=Morus notabilis TaxID=981085 RepID=W9QBL5_9ROSA|nr:hypothetical protein L484_016157 [Morus notabilis]